MSRGEILQALGLVPTPGCPMGDVVGSEQGRNQWGRMRFEAGEIGKRRDGVASRLERCHNGVPACSVDEWDGSSKCRGHGSEPHSWE